MLGRLLGFFREVLLAARVGVSAEADMAVLILTLPDFLISVLMAGGFGAALVPALRRLEGAERIALFRFVTTLAVLVSLGLAALIATSPGVVFRVLAPALPAEVTEPHFLAMRLTALSVPLAAISGVLGALLNARNTFFVVGLGTGVYNFVLCAFLFGLPSGVGLILPLALAVLAAAITRVAMLWLTAKPSPMPMIRAPGSADAQLLRLFVAGVLAVGITAAAQIMFRTLAGLEEPGALTAFAYALKLFLLPVMILFAPVATVLLPRFTDAPNDRRLVENGIAIMLVLALATLAAGLSSGEAIARLIYFRGAMTEDGMLAVTVIAQWMFLAIPFAALELIGAAALNARRQTGRVMIHAMIALVLAGGLAALRTDLVMPAFVFFYALLAILHLAALRLDISAVFRRLTSMRILLAIAFLAGVFAMDRLLVREGAVWTNAFMGFVIFGGIVGLWADQIRRFGALR